MKDTRLRVFMKFIELIEDTNEESEKVKEVGNILFDDFTGFSKFHNKQINVIINSLVDSLFPINPKFAKDWIEWWLFEGPKNDRGVSFDGEEIHQISLEELGEYLIKEYSP